MELRNFWRLQVTTATLHCGVMRCSNGLKYVFKGFNLFQRCLFAPTVYHVNYIKGYRPLLQEGSTFLRVSLSRYYAPRINHQITSRRSSRSRARDDRVEHDDRLCFENDTASLHGGVIGSAYSGIIDCVIVELDGGQ